MDDRHQVMTKAHFAFVFIVFRQKTAIFYITDNFYVKNKFCLPLWYLSRVSFQEVQKGPLAGTLDPEK
jgi:hypothetical protein